MHPDYNSPSELSSFLEKRGFSMQKKFGQNFLINEGARKKIAAALELKPGQSVWEVGPGLGAMTKILLECGARVKAFEIDRGFAECLREFFGDDGNFSLVEGDVLRTWKGQTVSCSLDGQSGQCNQVGQNGQGDKSGHGGSCEMPDYFFGNLPYNIAATLIGDTIEEGVRFAKCAFTVQKEVAQRVAAKAGSDDYSAFSVLCQWAYDVSVICDLGRANFWPRPNVDSRAVLFVRKENFPGCKDPRFFVRTLHALFSSRRKTVRNNLGAFLASHKIQEKCESILERTGIEPSARAEVLPCEKILLLSDCIQDAIIKEERPL